MICMILLFLIFFFFVLQRKKERIISYQKTKGGKENKWNIEKDTYPKNNLQNNLIELEKKYGNNFDVIYKNFILNVTLDKVTLHNNITFYYMKYDIPNRDFLFYPLLIEFLDPIDYIKNNNSYIAYLHKTDVSGKDLLDICININKALGVYKIYLYDESTVLCSPSLQKMPLKFIKLLSDGSTFYTKRGFKVDVTKNISTNYLFDDSKKLEKHINTYIKRIKNITIKDTINTINKILQLMNTVVNDDNENEFKVIYDTPTLISNTYVHNMSSNITEMIYHHNNYLNIINKNKKNMKYIYELLEYLFYNKCEDFILLLEMFDKYTSGFQYKNTKIDINTDIIEFIELLKNVIYSYTF